MICRGVIYRQAGRRISSLRRLLRLRLTCRPISQMLECDDGLGVADLTAGDHHHRLPEGNHHNFRVLSFGHHPTARSHAAAS